MFQFYAKPFGRFMAIGVRVTVVSQIIGLFYVVGEFLNTPGPWSLKSILPKPACIFVTDVAVLNNETIKHVFKSLDIFWNTRKKYVCEKGNIERHGRGGWQSLQQGTKNFWQRSWKVTRGFLLQHKNKLEGFELRLRLWNHTMMELWIRSGLQSRKSNCPESNTIGQPLSAHSTIRSVLSLQTVTKEDEVVINFRPIWQRTNSR